MSSRDLLGVVDKLYAASLEPDAWASALGAVTELMRADHTILVADGGLSAPLIAAHRVDDHALAQLLFAGGAGLLGPLDFANLPLGSLTMRRAIVPDDQFLRSSYYNDIIKPLNGFNSAFFRQHREGVGYSLAVCRSYGVDDFADEDVSVLHALLPHLTNAVEMTYRLAAAQSKSMSLLHLFNQLESGVIVTDASARPLVLNERAERIVAEADGLTIQAAGLAAAAWPDTRRLRQIIAILAQATNGFGDGQPSIERRRLRLDRPSLRPALMLTLAPISGHRTAPISGATPAVAIFLKELAAPIRIDKHAVAEAFQLTRREAEIAALIGEGQDLERIADALDLSVATVRSHLKRVFGKTATHRQSALASLVRELADPRPR